MSCELGIAIQNNPAHSDAVPRAPLGMPLLGIGALESPRTLEISGVRTRLASEMAELLKYMLTLMRHGLHLRLMQRDRMIYQQEVNLLIRNGRLHDEGIRKEAPCRELSTVCSCDLESSRTALLVAPVTPIFWKGCITVKLEKSQAFLILTSILAIFCSPYCSYGTISSACSWMAWRKSDTFCS